MLDFFLTQPIAILNACGVTLLITLLSSVSGTLVGACIWMASRNPLSKLIYTIVDLVRAVPNLIWIFAVYYFPFSEFNLPIPSPLLSAVIGLAISQAAYSADSIRAAYSQVPTSQLTGLAGIGASTSEQNRLVVFPNLVRLSWPAHVSFWIGNLKLSSLASVIGVPDLAYVARVTMANTFHSVEAWASVGIVYVVLTIPLAYSARLIERHSFFRQ